MDTILLKNKKINQDKLTNYGFIICNNCYMYSTSIIDDQFEIQIKITDDKIVTRTIEKCTDCEYILHLTDSVGEFVGRVKMEYQSVLNDIFKKCLDNNVFKSEQALQIIDYIKNNYTDELEYLWQRFPNYAVWRRKDNRTWYGLLLVIPKRKLNFDSDQNIEIINLRVDEQQKDVLIDNKSIFIGYHMNKKHWISILLDKSVDTIKIIELINKSYIIAGDDYKKL